LLANPHDDAAFERVVNLPPRGIGAKTLEGLRAQARTAGSSLWAAASAGGAGRSAGALAAFLVLIDHLQHETSEQPLGERVRILIERSGLIEHYRQEKGDRGEARVENLEELVTAAREYQSEDPDTDALSMFLTHAALESGENQGQAWQDCVQLMTLHSAKGLEFPLVFLTGLEEGLFPHERSAVEPTRLEEERRLCYVGMTRAMEELYLTYAEVRRLHGMERLGMPSRFLDEVPEELLAAVKVGPRPGGGVGLGRHVPARTPAPAPPRRPAVADRANGPLGRRVRHERFGEGVVLACEGAGEQARVQVHFKGEGPKWLVLAYARLEFLP
ncbi:MAG TPA: 3'-5' exonuclease, partial [Acidiferrobacteraceae bacterium]|nr:3'-5' exonuclease [Acidiferrobacteraceae bacterium]